MTQKVSEVVVSVKLPIAIYQVLERKASASNISVGTLLSAFIVASIRASVGSAARFVVQSVSAPQGRRRYVRVRDEDVPVMRAMVHANATADLIAEHFGISRASAGSWRRKILAETLIASDAA